MDNQYHVPVMLEECLEALEIKPEGFYADLTFGGGGHSRKIIEKLSTGKLYGFDQDDDAAKNALDDERFIFIQANFRFLQKYLKAYKCPPLDGILADLGISSHQIDTPERGFSTRFDAPLDMRMSKDLSITAKDIVNDYKEELLAKIFYQYADLSNSRNIAKVIVGARIKKQILTTNDLKNCLASVAPRHKEFQFFAQVFQALRIEVNEELKALEEMLMQSSEVLKKGGIFAVMTYHSLEDRLVKNYFQKGKFSGEEDKDIYGNSMRPFAPHGKKLVLPTEEEIKRNSRARSAKLRIAVKL
jgi:16S rRNA (cytosine1402-N4)-methyltransferase